ncbi:ATP-grasp domain-containing protein [Roseiconus lacunae]|uniref:ATP-grasp domain-containing protein n=1 Tax=Roseiconus lacunae TaxID=2605694 RepID=UPI0011F21E07|nr:RimK family alpha-L-glutamate ligase [Roseiconus lacunae]
MTVEPKRSASTVGAARFLMLGPSEGWHAEQLRAACRRHGCRVDAAGYESLASITATPHSTGSFSGNSIADRPVTTRHRCDAGPIEQYDGILTRTMPAASMERLTYRLAVLHGIADRIEGRPIAMVNPPRGLEWAIDKFATSMRLAAAGYPVPDTEVVQDRSEALDAFDRLGSDCIVKPIFGGEGRGVMRVSDRELAWTCFSSLEQLQATILIQRFVSPGGRDTRLLVIGDRVLGFRRINERSFRTNLKTGSSCERVDVDPAHVEAARSITRRFGLQFASVDIIDNDHGPPLFLEVNAIPGWKGAQSVCDDSIADLVIDRLRQLCRNGQLSINNGS